MCELLIQVIDTTNDDVYRNYQCLKRGDVIDVVPDGWKWSQRELTNPNWRIIKLPGVEVDAVVDLTHSEMSTTDPEVLRTGAYKKTWLARTKRLDIGLAQIPKAIRDYLADNDRVRPSYTVDTSKFDITSIKETKALVADF